MQQPIKEKQKSMFAFVSGVKNASNIIFYGEILIFGTFDSSQRLIIRSKFCLLAKYVWLFVLTLSKRLIRNTPPFVFGHVFRQFQVSPGSTYCTLGVSKVSCSLSLIVTSQFLGPLSVPFIRWLEKSEFHCICKDPNAAFL